MYQLGRATLYHRWSDNDPVTPGFDLNSPSPQRKQMNVQSPLSRFPFEYITLTVSLVVPGPYTSCSLE